MKRSLLFVVAASLAFAACQKKAENTEETSPAVETTPAPAPAPAPMDTMAHDTMNMSSTTSSM